MIFTSEAQIEAAMKGACSAAINSTCEKMWEQLKNYIMVDYYNTYTPTKYSRTMQFYKSAMHEMVSDLCGRIMMEAGMMSYTGKSPVWTGAQQLVGAEAGYHGQLWITGGGHFWTEFLAYFAANALPMLKSELQAQGVPVQ